MSKINLIGLDFEATGSNPWGTNVPIQIGLALPGGDTFGDYIGGWDWAAWSWEWEAEQVHGISQSTVDAAPHVGTVDSEAADFLRERITGSRMNNVIVGWNVGAYDRQFVTRWMPDLNSILSYRTLDLNSILFLASSSEKQYKRLKREAKEYAAELLEFTGLGWHDAVYDAAAALNSLQYLRRALLLDLPETA